MYPLSILRFSPAHVLKFTITYKKLGDEIMLDIVLHDMSLGEKQRTPDWTNRSRKSCKSLHGQSNSGMHPQLAGSDRLLARLADGSTDALVGGVTGLEGRGGHDVAQIRGDILGLTEVDGVNRRAELDLHVLDHAAHVSDVGLLVGDGELGLLLASQVSGQGDASSGLSLGLNGEHDGARQAVGGRLRAVDLNDVDGIPSSAHGLSLTALILGCKFRTKGYQNCG